MRTIARSYTFITFAVLLACQRPPVTHMAAMAATTDTPGSSGGTGVRIAKDGSIIVAGVFENTMTLGGTNLNSYGRHDIFLAKFNAQHRLLWVEAFGGPGNDFAPGAVVDDNGVITLCCDFENMLNLSARFALYCDGHGQAFIKVSPDGAGKEVVEVQAKGGIHETQINDLCIDARGAVHAVGDFTADTLLVRAFTLDGHAKDSSLMTAKGTTLFTLTRDPGTTSLHGWPEEGSVYALTNRISTMGDDKLLLFGTHTGLLKFDEHDASGFGAYIAVIDANGKAISAARVPLTCSNAASLTADGLGADGNGNVFALLGFKGNARSEQLNGSWSSGNGKDALLLKMDADASIRDVRRFGNGDDLLAKSLGIDRSIDRITVAGYHHGEVALEDELKLPPDGKYNGFILGYDDGLSVKSIDATRGPGQQFVLAMDARDGAIAIAGTYFGDGSIGGFALPAAKQGRFFVAAFAPAH